MSQRLDVALADVSNACPGSTRDVSLRSIRLHEELRRIDVRLTSAETCHI